MNLLHRIGKSWEEENNLNICNAISYLYKFNTDILNSLTIANI